MTEVMPWWLAQVARLQEMNRASEEAKGDEYTDQAVRRSTVYTREDLSMIVGLLMALNKKVAAAKTILLATATLVACITVRMCLEADRGCALWKNITMTYLPTIITCTRRIGH
jgi:hypothetical protein